MLLKLLIILALVIYVLSKIGGFFFRVDTASQKRNYQQRKENNIHENPNQKKDKHSNIKKNDYVDFEEVK